MKVKIFKSEARGAVTVPPSKSVSHRALIAAALCEGESFITNLLGCDDVIYTLDALKRLGATVTEEPDGYRISGIDIKKPHTGCDLYANESGSTLRFLIPILLLLGGEYRIYCKEGLLKRPLSVYEELFPDFIKKMDGYVWVSGSLSGGEYRIRADVSSQFISGLLFALPLCNADSKIILLGNLESRSYIELTLKAMADFGVRADFSGNVITVYKNQSYKERRFECEGDYSAAIFIDALSLISGGGVRALGLRADSVQGDRVYSEIFKELLSEGAVVDLSDCPDNAPMLFALAAYLGGARFTGTRRLKIKESDRAEAMRAELSKLGAELTVLENEVTVKKCALHAPSEPIDSHNDHRIAMAMAVLLTQLGGEILNAQAVSKSYPDFFSDLRSLGVSLKEEF